MKMLFVIFCSFLRYQVMLLRPGGDRAVVAELMLLKTQLMLVRRQSSRSPSMTPWQRAWIALLAAWIPAKRLARCAVVIRPATILAFHRFLVTKKYLKLFGRTGKPGRPPIPTEVRDLIVEIKKNNPRFGCPQIAALVMDRTGISVSEETVRRILTKHVPKYKGSGPSWLSFLASQADSLWSIDLFRAESILLQSHWVLVAMDQYSRKIIGFAFTKGSVNGETLCCMFNRILAAKTAPKRLSHDHDPLFLFERWVANMSVCGIEEVLSVSHVPWSHPYVERLIGSVRRECLDQTLFWNEVDLERKLAAYADYFNSARVHQGISGACPANMHSGIARVTADPANLKWRPYCDGLFKVPIAA